MLIADKINKDTIVLPLSGSNRAESIQELLDALVHKGYLKASIKLFSFIDAQESENCSTTGRGVAFPHSISKEINELVCILGVSTNGIIYDENDVHPCHIILLSLSPVNDSDAHRKFISRFRLLLSNSKDKIINSTSVSDVEIEIKNWEKKLIEEEL